VRGDDDEVDVLLAGKLHNLYMRWTVQYRRARRGRLRQRCRHLGQRRASVIFEALQQVRAIIPL